MGGLPLTYTELPLHHVLLNPMNVQKVQMLFLDQSAKNWTPMSQNGQLLLSSPFPTHISQCYPMMFLKTLAQTNIIDIRFVGLQFVVRSMMISGSTILDLYFIQGG